MEQCQARVRLAHTIPPAAFVTLMQQTVMMDKVAWAG